MFSRNLFDLATAFRTIRRQPAFTAIVVGTLALGIGTTTAMFALVHAALLRRLPYEDPDRLVLARRTYPGRLMMWNSPPDYYDYKDQTPGFQALAASHYEATDTRLFGGERPETVRGLEVTHDLIPMLGVRPVAGRLFTEAEARADAPEVVLVSARLAERRFGSAQAAVGKTLVIFRRKVAATVVGVLPSTFRFLDSADLWIPIRRGKGDGPNMRMAHNWVLVGRLKPGVTVEAVQRQLDVVSSRLQREYPATNAQKGLRVDPLQSTLMAPQRPAILVLTGAVALILLIACANVAGMLLTRSVSRRQELAVRAALGATRGRMAAQLVTESVLLGALAGVAGVLLAGWLRPLLALVTGLAEAGVVASGTEAQVLLFAVTASIATGVLSGVVPALRLSSLGLAEHLAPGGRATDGRSGAHLRKVLVTAQVALSCLLLVGAGLLVKSLAGLMTTDLRFNTEQLLAASFDLPVTDSEGRRRFASLVQEDLAAIPGVTDVALTSHLPVLEPWEDPLVWPKDRPPLDRSQARSALWRRVTPGFFRLMGIRLLAGRDLSADDRPDSPRVMVVNDTFARQILPGEQAVGQRVMMGNPASPDEYLIVGVVETARTEGVVGLPKPSAYVSTNQSPLPRARVLMRSGLPPEQLTRAVRKAIAARNADLVVNPVVTIDSLLADSLFSQRVTALTILGFAGLALLLAALGLYGVLAHDVARRTHEIGVRVALGAGAGRVMRQVLWRSASMVGPGIVTGLLAALAVTRVMSRFVGQDQVHQQQAALFPHGVAPVDPLTVAAVTGLLALVALAASARPAWRASHVDPVRALRGE
jgi:predicted permease